jgi:hypothetical protein
MCIIRICFMFYHLRNLSNWLNLASWSHLFISFSDDRLHQSSKLDATNSAHNFFNDLGFWLFTRGIVNTKTFFFYRKTIIVYSIKIFRSVFTVITKFTRKETSSAAWNHKQALPNAHLPVSSLELFGLWSSCEFVNNF